MILIGSKLNRKITIQNSQKHVFYHKSKIFSNQFCLFSTIENANPSFSLYNKIGGERKVSRIVDVFYKKVKANKEIKHFFIDADMEIQRSKFKEMVKSIFSANASKETSSSSQLNLKAVHEKLDLEESHFDIFKNLFQEALVDNKVSETEIIESLSVLEHYRNQVILKRH